MIVSTDQFDALRAVATDGINVGIQAEGIIEKPKDGDGRFGIDIAQASTDTITFRWMRRPNDGPALTEEIEALCPDIIWQGVGSVEAKAQIVTAVSTVQLWLD